METDDPRIKELQRRQKQALRQAKYRARRGLQVTVLVDAALRAQLEAYLFKHQADVDPSATLSSVIGKLLRTQLLRKR